MISSDKLAAGDPGGQGRARGKARKPWDLKLAGGGHSWLFEPCLGLLAFHQAQNTIGECLAAAALIKQRVSCLLNAQAGKQPPHSS